MTDNKRGRPALGGETPSTRVQLTLPAREYDALWRLARHQDVSVPTVIRSAIRRGLRRVLEDGPEDDA